MRGLLRGHGCRRERSYGRCPWGIRSERTCPLLTLLCRAAFGRAAAPAGRQPASREGHRSDRLPIPSASNSSLFLLALGTLPARLLEQECRPPFSLRASPLPEGALSPVCPGLQKWKDTPSESWAWGWGRQCGRWVRSCAPCWVFRREGCPGQRPVGDSRSW